MRKEANNPVSQAAAVMGKMGGKAGKGSNKKRGNPEYYRQLRAKRKNYPAPTWLKKSGETE